MKKIWIGYKKLITDSRNYIFFAGVLGLVWFFAGIATVTLFPFVLPSFLRFLQDTFQNILGDINTISNWELARGLFIQNTTASVYNLFLGVVLGIVPTVSLALNFFALGFLAGPFIHPDLFPGLAATPAVFILSTAPHGIFEIPAFLLSAAFGIRLGWAWLMPDAAGKRWKVFRSALLDVVKILPLIVALLIIAAFIEAFVTHQLVS
jgi:stage II sporulation protein M